MQPDILETIEITPSQEPAGSVIWLHGLGADGHDFAPITRQLHAARQYPIRFIFPHAPMRPVTINNGYVMRAWYDIAALDMSSREDEDGILDSEAHIQQLIQREQSRGIASENIVLAGFSQGGAIALHTGLRYPQRLGGIIALSCYLPLLQQFSNENLPANINIPILMAHGIYDDVVPITLARHSREQLAAQGYTIEWHEFPMAHTVSEREIEDIDNWLLRCIS